MTLIRECGGDLLSVPVEAIVNPANCVGAMGAGVALQIRRAFPGVGFHFTKACRDGRVRPGVVIHSETGTTTPRLVLHLPTKRHWSDRSRIEDVAEGLKTLRYALLVHRVKSVAVPALGCGLGGLRWDQVRPLVMEALRDSYAETAWVFPPQAAPPVVCPGMAVTHR